MTIRIHNLGKWAKLEPDSVLEMPGTGIRQIEVEVNCEAPTAFHALEKVEGEADKLTFIGVCVGHETLQFAGRGDVDLVPTSEADVWFFTNVGDEIATDVPGAVSLAKLMTRRTRNPQLELMMFKQQQNALAREQVQANQIAELRAMMEAQSAAAGADPKTGEIVEPVVSAGASAAGAGGGEGTPGGAVEPAVAGAGASA